MKLRYVSRFDARVPAPVAVIGLFEGERQLPEGLAPLETALGGRLVELIRAGKFAGKDNEVREFTPVDGKFERVFVVGLGKREKLTAERCRRFAGTAQRRVDGEKLKAYVSYLGVSLSDGESSVDAATVFEAVAEGMLLASYQFRGWKTDDAPVRVETAHLQVPKPHENAAKRGEIIAEGTMLSRDLVNAPGNRMTPTMLADAAKKMAKANGVRCEVWERARLEKERMHLLLGVARGSVEEPRFVILEYGKPVKGKGPLVFVGKGITFDTGGISMKPPANMDQMKYDMSGAAAVIGAMHNIARLKLKGHFIGLIPTTENMPGGKATKPGDVHDSRDGKTVEVLNTDAEGRLVLADALAYAKGLKPSAVYDIATLTGACVIALGHVVGLMGNNEAIIQAAKDAAAYTGEQVWELPMFDEYAEGLRGEVADLKNISGGRGAGTITAAKFLEKFTSYPWAHFDIAGAAWEEKSHPYRPKGGTGVGARLFTRIAAGWF
jgi:leucyl aminopeptidase